MAYKVVLRRTNGRVVAEKRAISRQAAARIKFEWEKKHGNTHQVTIEETK